MSARTTNVLSTSAQVMPMPRITAPMRPSAHIERWIGRSISAMGSAMPTVQPVMGERLIEAAQP